MADLKKEIFAHGGSRTEPPFFSPTAAPWTATATMNGYSSHTFSLINGKNELFYVKWQFKTKQGIKNFTREQADEVRGKDPDYALRGMLAEDWNK